MGLRDKNQSPQNLEAGKEILIPTWKQTGISYILK